MRLTMTTDDAPSTPDEENENQPYWRQRRWLVSAVFLGVVLLVGVVAIVVGGGPTGSAPAVAGPVIGELGPDGARPQQCRTDDSDQRVPETAPRDVTWWPLNGAQTPRSASAGPLKSTGPLRWCFAHTPMGAVMAANVIPRQMSGPDWRLVLDQQLVPGFSRDYFEAMRESLTDVGTTRTTTSLAGFSVVTYSPETARIRILVRLATASYAAADYTLDWDGVDWKVRPLNAGGLHTEAIAVFSLAGFVLWKAT